MKRLGVVVLVALIGMRSGAGCAERVLDRRLSLNLWGVGFRELAVEVKARTGVDIVFFLPDIPAGENIDNVYIVTGEVSLASVLEALARRFSFRFRVAETGRVEVSKGYGWVPSEPALRFARMRCLAAAEGCGAEAMRVFLGEFLKPLPLLHGGFSLKVEPYPTREDPGGLRATAVLPAELADYLVRGIDCLSGSSGDVAAGDGTFVLAREYDADWERMLSRPVAPPSGGDLRSALAEVAAQAGAVFVLLAPPAGEGGGLPADMVRYTFGSVCERIASGWGLGRRVFLASGGVVFERGTENDYETDARSRELFWSGLAVRGVDAAAAAAKFGGAPGLLASLRRDVFPGVWRDPVCTMVYSPVTGRMAVVAPVNVTEAVARRVAAIAAW